MSDMITFDTESYLKPQYASYALVAENSPMLKRVIPAFDFDLGIDAVEISERLKQTLRDSKAYGVAASQCGLDHRVICIGSEDSFITMFNPEITKFSNDTNHLEEGCLSFPLLILSITRSKDIVVKYQDENGKTNELGLTGLSARVVQHEVDHLNGITFQSKAKPLALKSGLKRREKAFRKYFRGNILQKKLNELQQ